VELGVYSLERRVAVGGMGEVWSGRRPSGAPVALKVLSAAQARRPSLRLALEREIRAAAALSHPNVIALLDQGRVTSETAAASAGALAEGAPWLAMEWLPGTLAGAPPASWAGAREALAGVLEGLAWAHACGVLHRDLKPGNVLLRDTAPVLADFGLARLPEARPSAQEPGSRGGTAGYMAPEQRRGEALAQGPWTDLYAAGCLAWWLVTGLRPPDARLGLPLLRPLFPCPPGLEAWVGWLMSPDPARRPARAREALLALRALGEVSAAGVSSRPTADPAWTRTLTRGRTAPVGPRSAGPRSAGPRSAGPRSAGPRSAGPRSAGPRSAGPRSAGPRSAGAAATSDRASAAPARLPLPGSWRGGSPPEVAVGPGLAPLREPPLVGREAERDRLWEALRAAAGGGHRVVALRGVAGVGKSRLLGWLGRAAHALGGAEVLRLRYTPDGADPLPEALAGLPLGPAARRALEDTAAPGGGPAARQAAIAGVLREVAGRGLLVVLIDDAHWARGALRLLGRLRDVPLLVALAVGEEALAGRAEAGLLAALGAQEIALGPLPERESRALLAALLGLSGPASAALAARTAGNPLLAVALVRAQIDRGELALTDRGYAPRSGAPPAPPEELAARWRGLARAQCRGLPAGAVDALALAGCLGMQIDRRDWEAACEGAGVAPAAARALVRRLLDRRLALEIPGGWAFANALLREGALATAGPERLRALHRACALALAPRADAPHLEERLGRHWLAGGEPALAAPRLLRAAHQRCLADDYDLAHALLEQHRGAADAEGARAGRLLRAEVLRHQGRGEEALAALASLGELSALPAGVRRLALRERGQLALRAGRLAAAEEALAGALAAAREQSADAGIADALAGLAEIARCRGALARSRALLEEAVAAYLRAGATSGALSAERSLAALDSASGALDRARSRLEALLPRVGRRRWPAIRAACLSELGDLARKAGELARAEALLAEARALYRDLGSPAVLVCALNQGLVALAAGQAARARARFIEARGLEEALDRPDYALFSEAGLLACDAAGGRWRAWPRRMAALERAWARGPRRDPDLVWLLERAAQSALDAGHPRRAARARALAARAAVDSAANGAPREQNAQHPEA
jgi:hypothetical protein